MSYYTKIFKKLAPELDALHVETLAYDIGSTLNGMPPEFFDEIARLARDIGPARLAERHEAATGAAA